MSRRAGDKSTADVVVVGAGLIGLTIALEMHRRGARVCVVERGLAMGQASIAAAGMLAVDDPGNPPELLPLARLSVGMYPEFLRRVEALSGIAVPFQTQTALQYAADGRVTRLAERSVDPRQLGAAVLAAVRAASIEIMEETEVEAVTTWDEGVRVVYAAGAWTAEAVGGAIRVAPRKGQMLRVRVPEGMRLAEVHRSERVYVVPRTVGAQAGTAVIGATIEDAGFDTAVHAADLARLRGFAAELVPGLGSEIEAPMVEAWAGLRPATPDGLPVMGASGLRFVASGHYRNGVLLAPATAVVMADLMMGKTPEIDLAAFRVERFLR
jgi:glycine oxidase